jgi:hypothetical protein
MKKNAFFLLLLVFIVFSMHAQKKINFSFEDNHIPFFDLKTTDSYETVRRKLSGPGYEVITEEDQYRDIISEKYKNERVYVMYPNNQILEENENMNFLLWYIGGEIASFTKFLIPKSEFDILVEAFGLRSDCIRKESHSMLSDFITYEVTIGKLRFSLQYNKRSGFGTFLYSNLDFFDRRVN